MCCSCGRAGFFGVCQGRSDARAPCAGGPAGERAGQLAARCALERVARVFGARGAAGAAAAGAGVLAARRAGRGAAVGGRRGRPAGAAAAGAEPMASRAGSCSNRHDGWGSKAVQKTCCGQVPNRRSIAPSVARLGVSRVATCKPPCAALHACFSTAGLDRPVAHCLEASESMSSASLAASQAQRVRVLTVRVYRPGVGARAAAAAAAATAAAVDERRPGVRAAWAAGPLPRPVRQQPALAAQQYRFACARPALPYASCPARPRASLQHNPMGLPGEVIGQVCRAAASSCWAQARCGGGVAAVVPGHPCHLRIRDAVARRPVAGRGHAARRAGRIPERRRRRRRQRRRRRRRWRRQQRRRRRP